MYRFTVLAAAALLLAACGAGHETGTRGPATLRVEVLAVLPHDPDLFTEGLDVARSAHGLVLYESTGLHGQSLLRASAFPAGRTLEQVRLPDELFGEGIAVVDGRIWQWTWKRGIAIERRRGDLAALQRVRYRGQGWGLCFDGRRLVASDGSARLTFRDPRTFEPLGGVRVTLHGHPVDRLNELECADGTVWSNVWRTHRIVRIDPGSGRVTGVVDASGLLDPGQRDGAGVLNGIAAIPGTDQFLVTGKNWPSMFRVRFVPAGPA